jgi:hypothetical protein
MANFMANFLFSRASGLRRDLVFRPKRQCNFAHCIICPVEMEKWYASRFAPCYSQSLSSLAVMTAKLQRRNNMRL